MKGKVVYKRKLDAAGDWVDVPEFFIDGKRVSKKKFLAAFPDKALAEAPGGHRAGCWPIESMAVGVHPDQIPEAVAHSRSRGVPLEFTADGKAILTDRGHRREVLRTLGMHDNNGGYGDG
jgi:hypothetical protein